MSRASHKAVAHNSSNPIVKRTGLPESDAFAATNQTPMTAITALSNGLIQCTFFS